MGISSYLMIATRCLLHQLVSPGLLHVERAEKDGHPREDLPVTKCKDQCSNNMACLSLDF
jgi:hypothetical protein